MKAKKSAAESLAAISNLINGALVNPEILAALLPYGYTEERIRAEGLEKLTAVQALFTEQQKEYGEQFTATQKSKSLFDEAYKSYMRLLGLTRIALKNHTGALHSLRATGSRNRSMTGFLKDGRTFYQNLLNQPELLAAVAPFGIQPQGLEAGIEQINALEAAHHAFLKEKGEAQDATATRDKAFDELYDWYSDFRAVARIALYDRQQLIEKLGIVVKR